MLNVNEWATLNNLLMNTGKTKMMVVCGKRSTVGTQINVNLDGSLISRVSNAKLLGVEMDSELSFTNHDFTAKKILKRLGVLKRVSSYLPVAERVLFYNAMIKPLFMYCSVVWSNCSQDNIMKFLNFRSELPG